jgi:dTDP-L-rhamnose 4-epimerase
MTKYKILITGGAGFIGSHLALSLKARGHEVTVMDNLSPQIHGENSPLLKTIENQVRFLRGDVRSRDDWMMALQGQNAVIHLAAETGTGQSMYEIERYADVNVRGTSLLLDILTNNSHGVKKLVVASSRAIYGEGKYACDTHGIVYPTARAAADMHAGDFAVKCPKCGHNVSLLPTDEDSKIHPTSVYGISKQVQEQLVLTVGRSLGISSVALRYQNVYGPGQSLSNPYTGILSIFSTRLRNGNDIAVFEDGQESRDFVYIDDVVQATTLALEHPGIAHESLNVGSGVRTNVQTVAQTLKQALGSDAAIRITGNFRVGDIRDNYADITRIRQLLNFEPRVSFEEGVARFIAWVNSQAIANDTYDRSIAEMKAKGLYQ